METEKPSFRDEFFALMVKYKYGFPDLEKEVLSLYGLKLVTMKQGQNNDQERKKKKEPT